MSNNFMGDEFNKMMHSFSESVGAELKKINQQMTQISESILEVTKPLQSIKFPNMKEWNNSIKETMAYITKGLKDYLVSLEDYKKFCLLLGYPPHDDVSIPEIRQIVEIYHEVNGNIDKLKPIIDNFYIEKFNANYIKEEFFEKWAKSDLLSKRLKIIEESISCFEQGLCFSAIPILFSQLEGMVADGYNHSDKMNGVQLRQYLRDLFVSENDFSFDSQLMEFYTDIIIVGFGHNQPIKSFLSRHAIMHGGDVEYGTQENYIKLILFFDSVFDKLIGKNSN